MVSWNIIYTQLKHLIFLADNASISLKITLFLSFISSARYVKCSMLSRLGNLCAVRFIKPGRYRWHHIFNFLILLNIFLTWPIRVRISSEYSMFSLTIVSRFLHFFVFSTNCSLIHNLFFGVVILVW